MLFSAHIIDTNPITALRRNTPQPGDAPGLLSALTLTCAPFSAGVLPRPQFQREAILACWRDEASLDQFLSDHPVGQVFAEGWHVRMELFRAVGIWPGVDEDMKAAAAEVTIPTDGPTVAITIGTFYVRSFLKFLRVNGDLEKQYLEADGALWGTGMTNLPKQLVGTLSLWESASNATEYMRTGAHGAAVKAHYDPKKDPTGHTFVTGGGFFGFRPISSSGSLGGRNPLADGLLHPN